MYYRVFVVALIPLLVGAEPLEVPSSSGGIIDKEIEQQYEQKEVPLEKQVPQVEVEPPVKEIEMPAAQKVRINRIIVEGNTVLSKKQLQSVICLYENTEMSIYDIKELCQTLQDLYAAEGYFLLKVYAPEQEVIRHVLYIEVVEATLGRIEVVGNKHYTTKFIQSYFKKFLGKNPNYQDLMKTLFLINENSDLKVGAVFAKGQDSGTVDMILQVEDKDPFHISLDVNNYGSNVTTKNRSGLRTDVGNVFHDGDMLSMIGVVGYPPRRLRFVDAIYTTPLNRSGSDLEFSFLFSDFQVPQMKELNIHGTTQIAGVKFTQAMQRSKKLNTDIYTSFEYKQIRNYAQHAVSAYDKLREVSLGCKVDYMDALRGHNVADLAVFCGIPNLLGGLRPVDASCSRKDAGGRFVYIDGNYQRIQPLSTYSSMLINFQGQFSFYKLPISEEFYIGGINTVRGYPLATALGDSGFCANLEFRVPPFFLKSSTVPFTKKKWKDVFQFVGFVDHGEVFVYGGGISDQANRLYLTSAGLGARIFGPYGINCSMDVGFPLVDRKLKTQDAIFYFRVNMRFL
jgi:hemolysin activation/secretion protein